MPNLNIPISEELLREINMAALRSDKRQKEWVLAALTLVARAEQASPLDSAIEAIANLPAHSIPWTANNFCQTHEKPMKDFGTKWVCEGPPQHSVPK